MSKNNDRHVTPDGKKWKVIAAGAGRASSVHDTQHEAQQRAREIIENLGGGELVIHDRRGQIRDKDTVPHGNDPFPPRDTR